MNQQQDVNKIIDQISGEWAQDMATAKKRIGVLLEENRLLKEELDRLTDNKEKKPLTPAK